MDKLGLLIDRNYKRCEYEKNRIYKGTFRCIYLCKFVTFTNIGLRDPRLDRTSVL